MSFRRLRALVVCLAAGISLVLCRVYWVGQNAGYAQSALQQTEREAALPPDRGNFYDRTGRLLTGAADGWYALCVPGSDGYAELLPYVSYAEQTELYRRRNDTSLFFVPVDRDISALGIPCRRLAQRYLPLPIAVHLLGYRNGEGQGVAGLERAYDALLSASGDEVVAACAASAQGLPLTGSEPVFVTRHTGTGQGVALTLDADIQRLCEGVADLHMTRGCIVVLQPDTGEILAAVSVPRYDPNDVAKSIAADDTSLIDRLLTPFCVGSVFKIVAAAAAYDAGLDWFTADCTGSVTVGSQTYRCAQSRAHGEVNLRAALAQSCNCYFIELGQKLGAERLAAAAKAFGLGQSIPLAPGLQSDAASLPSAAQLQNAGDLALFSFGQGALTATPLQIAAMTNVLANGGLYRTPAAVQGVRRADGSIAPNEVPASRRVCSAATAKVLRSMLHTVVEEGIGSDAMTGAGACAGKTGTAQTGQFDADGRELLNYWFTGFYPADAPRYTITVLQDAQQAPETSSAAVFADVVQGLHVLDTAAAVPDAAAAKNS